MSMILRMRRPSLVLASTMSLLFSPLMADHVGDTTAASTYEHLPGFYADLEEPKPTWKMSDHVAPPPPNTWTVNRPRTSTTLASTQEKSGGKHGNYEKHAGKQGKHAGKQGKHAKKHGSKYGKHGSKYGKHGSKYGKHGSKYGKHGSKYGKHGSKYGKHGSKYGKHGSKYGKHGGKHGGNRGKYPTITPPSNIWRAKTLPVTYVPPITRIGPIPEPILSVPIDVDGKPPVLEPNPSTSVLLNPTMIGIDPILEPVVPLPDLSTPGLVDPEEPVPSPNSTPTPVPTSIDAIAGDDEEEIIPQGNDANVNTQLSSEACPTFQSSFGVLAVVTGSTLGLLLLA